MKKFAWILFLCLFCCGSQSKAPSNSPSEVVKSYVEALKNNDQEAALSCWTIKGAPVPADKKKLARAALALAMVVEKRMVKDSEYRIVEETKQDETAFVTVERNFVPQNTVTQIQVRLIVDDGAWRIAQWGVRD